MNNLKKLDFFIFNGGGLWEKEQGMREICIKIIKWANGNAIW